MNFGRQCLANRNPKQGAAYWAEQVRRYGQKMIAPVDSFESTNSLRFASDVDSTGDGGSDLPQETAEPEGRSIGQLMGGYLFGVAEGLVPFAALGHGIGDEYGFSRNKYEEVRIGLAIGQIVGDVSQKLASLLSVRKW